MATNPEARLTLKIKKALIARGAYAAKIHGGQYGAGVPDLLVCSEGHFYGMEIKVPGRERTLTKLQQHNITQITDAGGWAGVVTSVEQALEICELD